MPRGGGAADPLRNRLNPTTRGHSYTLSQSRRVATGGRGFGRRLLCRRRGSGGGPPVGVVVSVGGTRGLGPDFFDRPVLLRPEAPIDRDAQFLAEGGDDGTERAIPDEILEALLVVEPFLEIVADRLPACFRARQVGDRLADDAPDFGTLRALPLGLVGGCGFRLAGRCRLGRVVPAVPTLGRRFRVPRLAAFEEVLFQRPAPADRAGDSFEDEADIGASAAQER